MLEFDFTVNKSFLNPKYNGPITVPEKHHPKLCNQGLDEGELTIIFPRGERISGKMHFSKAGWGQYYQIRTDQKSSVPGYLKRGQELKVSLFNDSSSKYVAIEYANNEL